MNWRQDSSRRSGNEVEEVPRQEGGESVAFSKVSLERKKIYKNRFLEELACFSDSVYFKDCYARRLHSGSEGGGYYSNNLFS